MPITTWEPEPLTPSAAATAFDATTWASTEQASLQRTRTGRRIFLPARRPARAADRAAAVTVTFALGGVVS